MVQGSEGTLQRPPCDSLTTSCLAHQHGGVSGVLGLVELNDFGNGEWSDLQTFLMKLRLNGFLQLQVIRRFAFALTIR